MDTRDEPANVPPPAAGTASGLSESRARIGGATIPGADSSLDLDPLSDADLSLQASLVVAEYRALRDELQKRVELRQQIVALTLLAAGTFFTVGVQPGVSPLVLLLYPILAQYLAFSWEHHHRRTDDIATFVRYRLEKYLPAQARWELYLEDLRSAQPRLARNLMSNTQVFIVTQLVAVGLGVGRALLTFLSLKSGTISLNLLHVNLQNPIELVVQLASPALYFLLAVVDVVVIIRTRPTLPKKAASLRDVPPPASR